MTPWHVFVVDGPLDETRAFATGFAAARGEHVEVLFGRDVDLEETHESLAGRLRELLTRTGHEVVLVRQGSADAFAAALGGQRALRVIARHVVGAASVGFRVELFSHALARAIRQDLMSDLPEGVRLVERAESEEKHPDASVADRYAPLHHYVFRASGRFVGEPPGVLEMRRRARSHDFVEVERVRLEEKA